ncbi:MAG TPA: patatin-like phospholipase family protein [Burkholderiaceae bacterium]|nr:patatin-like phospholipase family protein [Burkholderiaceae bacterium]
MSGIDAIRHESQWRAWLRALGAALAAAGILAGCVTAVYDRATNEPLSEATPPIGAGRADIMSEYSVALAFSGGGLRASAFAYGVLTALRETETPHGDLLGDVVQINSVSGGSLTAAYYGLYGREGLDRFRSEVLLPGLQDRLRQSLLNPANLMRLLGGGLNGRAEFGDELDRSVFHGATFAALHARHGPEIRIHATDIYHRIGFPFLPEAFFLLCSDLSRYRIADAVAASMAVPLVFAPVVVRSFPGACRPIPPNLEGFLAPKPGAPQGIRALARAAAAYGDPTRPVFIRLADGGLTDNLGVSSFVNARAAFATPYAPLSAHEAVTVRRLLFIVVDASRPPRGDWIFLDGAPSAIDVALAATDAAIDSAARKSADALGSMIHEWERALIAYRCSLSPAEVAALSGPARWDCADVRISVVYANLDAVPSPLRERVEAIPTRLSLPDADIEAAIEAGREATLGLQQLRTYAAERRANEIDTARPPRGDARSISQADTTSGLAAQPAPGR